MFASFLSNASLSAWVSGTVTGLGLFAVVGAQSAFVLRQGILRAHVAYVLLTCAAVDALVIFGSVTGLQATLAYAPWLSDAVLIAGAGFLAIYAWRSAGRAWRGDGGLGTAGGAALSRGAAVLAALGFSLLNPHFWLDMVVVGSVAHGFGDARLAFAGGAFTASLFWLTSLSVGARLLAPWFSRPGAWRLLDACVAAIMLALAMRLLAGFF